MFLDEENIWLICGAFEEASDVDLLLQSLRANSYSSDVECGQGDLNVQHHAWRGWGRLGGRVTTTKVDVWESSLAVCSLLGSERGNDCCPGCQSVSSTERE